LEPYLRAAEVIGQPFREIERAGAADVVFQQVLELRPERRVGLGRAIFTLQIEDQRHQRFGDVAAAELAEMPAFVGLVAEGVGLRLAHDARAAWQKAAILSTSLTPGALSSPVEASTSGAPVRRMASATVCGVSPPARPQGTVWRKFASSDQSNASPVPPG